MRRAEASVAAISRSVSPVDRAAAASSARTASSPASAARQAAQNRPSLRLWLSGASPATQLARWPRSPRWALAGWAAAWRCGFEQRDGLAPVQVAGFGLVADEPVGLSGDLGRRGEDVAAVRSGSPGGGGAACRSAGRCR